jgi:hypothetical protein
LLELKPEPYHFGGAVAVAKIIHEFFVCYEQSYGAVSRNEIDLKGAKSLYIVDPIIVAEPSHLSGAGAVTKKVLKEIFFQF